MSSDTAQSAVPIPPDGLSIPGLMDMAARIRCDIIEMVHAAGEGHPGGSLSSADLITALYFRVLRIDPRCPDWPDRDRFILSKGHACPAWYAALIERGFLARSHLTTLRRLDSVLQGHPDMCKAPGIDMTAGSLGHGLSAGLGMALAARLHQRDYRVFVIIGDGESQEGAIWEAALAAPGMGAGNLVAITDQNRIQNDDFVARVIPMEPLADKWRAFGWRVVEIDGHDMAQIVAALEAVDPRSVQPTMIVAHTIKGKGVSFMEDDPAWHGRAPNDAEAAQALAEIRAAAGWEVAHAR